MFILQNTLQTVKEDRIKNSEQILIRSSQTLRLFLGDIHQTTEEIATHNGIRKAIQDYGDLEIPLREKIDQFVQGQFQIAKDKNPYIQQLFLITQSGEVLNDEDTYSIDSQEFFKSPYFKSLKNKEDEVLWSYEAPPSFFVKGPHEKMFFTLQAIGGLETDKSVGYLVSIINTQSMNDVYQDMLLGLPEELSVYDNSHHSFIIPSEYPIDEQLIQGFIQEETFYKVKEIKIKGKSYAVGVAPLGPLNWYTASVMPIDKIIGNVKDIYKGKVWVYILGGVFFITWILLLNIIVAKLAKIKFVEKSIEEIEKMKNKELAQYKEEDIQHLKDTEVLVERKDLAKISEYIYFWKKELLEEDTEKERKE